MFPWIDFFTYLLATGATPGPNTILSMTNAGHLGFRRTLPFLFGILCGFSAVAAICALLCGALARILPQIQPVILLLSAAYMLYLAWKLFTSDGELRIGRRGSDFKSGALFQFVNPKVYLYCVVSIQAYILPVYAGNLPAILGITAILVGVAFCINLCWAAFGAVFRTLFLRRGRLINRLMALVLVLCTIRLFF